MIFAAGLGTRLRPLTDDKPKAMVSVNHKTLLEINIEKFVSYGIDPIVVNVHHFADMMVEYIEQLKTKYNVTISISDERNLLLDTGGGLLKAKKNFIDKKKIISEKNFFNSEKKKIISVKNLILLHNVDILSDIDFDDMQQVFLATSPLALLAVQKRKTQRYLIFNENNELCGWTNTATNEKIITRKYKQEKLYAFSGIHIVNKDIFEKINKNGAFSIIEMYLELSKDYIIKPYIHSGKWLDVGKLENLEKAKQMFF